MKNSFTKTLYHAFVCRWYGVKSFRGGWMLTQSFVNDYKKSKASWWKIAKVHLKGWSYNDWSILGITDQNRHHYLSTLQYCQLHPFNGIYSSWIDDKLTLKYILDGTAAGAYMPDYYFQLFEKGSVLPLMDAPMEYASKRLEGIADLLVAKRMLAFKLIKGALGKGFYKAEYNERGFWMNDKLFDRAGFIDYISKLSGYLISEFLLPHPYFAKYCDKSVGCLRFVVGRRKDGTLQDIYSFMRFGTTQSQFVENYNAGGVLAIVRNGKFTEGNMLDFTSNTNRIVLNHPDNDVPLQGEIPHWQEVVKAAHLIADAMPQMSYMGIDFCITQDNRVKIIEINSLTSLDSLQTDQSIFNTDGGSFFKERLQLLK